MPNSITIAELQDLAIRVNEAGQQTLAGCLHLVIPAIQNLKLDGLFSVMTIYKINTIKVDERDKPDE